MDIDNKMEEQTKMRVVLRVRPFNAREIHVSPKNIVEMKDSTLILTNPESEEGQVKVFNFDSCHWSHDGFTVNENGQAVAAGQGSRYSGQEAMFQDIGAPALERAWDGYNVGILAYGMTGSGKSHTMLGYSANPGLVHLCCRQLFSQMNSNLQHKYKVTFSLMEIYNEKVVDLLSKSSNALTIRSKPNQGVYVQDLTVMPAKTSDQMEELLQVGLRNRSVLATNMNSTSSRSHLIVTIHFIQFIKGANGSRTKRRSRLRFVDMAGSERTNKTGTTGAGLREGQMINMSISGLSNVMSALASQKEGKKTFVPYRDTKLTRLLSEELGGNCATTLLVTVSPAAFNYDETLSTLRFANRAFMIMQKPKVNDLDVDTAINACKESIAQQETELASAESEEAKQGHQHLIETHKLSIQKLESPWKETDSKEKVGSWWSASVKLEQPELETSPFLQNISQDNQLSGVVKHVITQGPILLGSSETECVKIQLSGLGIQPQHAIMMNTGTSLTIAPCSSKATIHINGVPITTMTTLKHLDHIKLGACELFILIGFPSDRSDKNVHVAKHMHEKCLTELAENHPLSPQLAPSGNSTVRAQTAALMLFQEFTDFLPQVAQAHALAASLGKNIDFEVEVRPDEKDVRTFFVRVIDHDLGLEWVWSKMKFENRKLSMEDLYETLLSTGKVPQLVSGLNNPFYDTDNLDVYLGRCTVSMHNIVFHTPVDDDVPVLDFHGKPVGTVHVKVAAGNSNGEPVQVKGAALHDPRDLTGKALRLLCTVTGFCGVLWVAAQPQRGVYCKLLMEGEKQTLTTETVCGVVSGKFKKTFQFTFDSVTQSVLDFLMTKGLLLELWGTQASSAPHPAQSASPPSSPAKQPSPSPVQNPQDPQTSDNNDTSNDLIIRTAQLEKQQTKNGSSACVCS